ncbi:MAG: glycosyltransferase family 4 protein [Planctomycetota bacterium]
MRIVHIITRMIVGGAQENTRFNCLDLVRDYGDDVTLITGPSLGAEGSLLDKYQDPDLKTILVPELIRSIRPWTDLRAARILQKHLTQLRPDVVHTHSAKAGILGRSVAWKLKIPCVVHTVHGAPFHPYQAWPVRKLYQICERWAARRCHRLISVADAMTDLLVEAKIAERSKFVTIYSGMDIEPFLNADQNRLQLRKDLGIRPEDIVVGKIARLFHLKGHQYLLACAQRVVQADPRIRFLLVGDGILRESLEKEIASMGLKNHFIFTGLVPPHEIPDLIGAMDMLMHVSLREGLARALPQALLAGKPVISYDIDGAKEVVIEGQTGILLPPKSIQPLGDAILKLANDADLRTRLGLQGRLLCQERFGHQSMTKQIRRLYQQILSG